MNAAARFSELSVSSAPNHDPAIQCVHCREHAVRRVAPRIGRCAACRALTPFPSAAAWISHGSAYAIPFAVGDLLRGRYRLRELLGEGAHGAAFIAHHEFLNHPCVVKIIPFKTENTSESLVDRLRIEASAGFRVNHHNVVRVLDGDVIDGACYFVMEYIDGVDLAAATEVGVLMDWRQAVRVAVDAASGLEAVHAAGLVHNDVKPSNLLLGADGSVRVADLGVVNLAAPTSSEGSDNHGALRGTLGYTAPEVLARDHNSSPAADLYSLGAAIYELLTGRLPRGDSLYKTWLASGKDRVTWPADLPETTPDWFVAAILRLLEADPSQRFGSAGELVEHLEHPTTAVMRPVRAKEKRPEPRGLVVAPFKNATQDGVDDWLGHAIADHLARSLAATPAVYVVDTDQFLQTLERIEGRGTTLQARQLREAARLSGAATIVSGDFERTGHEIRICARITQVAHRDPTELPSVQGALSSLAELEVELLGQITDVLGLGPAAAPAARFAGEDILAADERFFTAKRAFLNGDYETAVRLGREAIHLDPRNGDTIGFVGACCARMGRYEEAVQYNRRLEELAEREKDQRLAAQARANLGAMHYFRGDYDAARDCLVDAVESAERLGLTTEDAQIRNNLGFVLLQLGRQAEAESTFQRAVTALRRYGALVALIGPYNGLGHVCREQQRYDEAREYFRRALSLAQEGDDNVNTGVAFMNLGHCAMLQGRLPDAKHELAVALNILEKTSFWNGLARVYEYMAELNLRLSNWREAARCAEQRIQLAQRHANKSMEAAAMRQRDEALAREQNDDDDRVA